MIETKLKNGLQKTAAAKKHRGEQGAALAITVIVVAILAVVGLTALAFSSSEVRIAGSDLQRTQTFYATAAAIEKMTNDFSNLFRTKLNPTPEDLTTIANTPPDALAKEGFSFSQTLLEDTQRLSELRDVQNLSDKVYPRVNISDGPYAGLYASVIPYKITSLGTMNSTGVKVKLEREFNNYLVPLFQFGMFSNEDIELHPGPLMTFNGRVHANGSIYALRNTKLLNRVTMGGELVRDATRGGEPNTQTGASEVYFEVNGINVQSTLGNGSVKSSGSTVGGPYLTDDRTQRGYYPESPKGVPNANWEKDSVKTAAVDTPNQFGGQVLTHTTGATELKLPLEVGGSSNAELIKRALPSDSQILTASRYHSKSQIRILIDEAGAGSGADNVAGIPATDGVVLSNDDAGFNPLPLGDGSVLRRIDDSGAYVAGDKLLIQKKADGTTQTAKTVRGIKNVAKTVNGNYIPPGAGLTGKILIQVVKPDGTTEDVTKQILSLGMTEGEPNGIVYLQRPMWSAFVQGSRDRTGSGFDLVNLTRNFQSIADGEITALNPAMYYANRGFLDTDEGAANDDGGNPTRQAVPTSDGGTPTPQNEIVPINVYNVREGWVRSTLDAKNVYYERGVTSVVELNMRNLARWLDGKYDANLLAGTNAVSTNVKGDEGYVVYVSDRRGDNVKPEYLNTGTSYASTNGSVDNEDIYGPNNVLDAGEDVLDFGWDASRGGASKKGTLQKDIDELPDTGANYPWSSSWSSVNDRIPRAEATMRYSTGYFRRAVRLFDGETMSFTPDVAKKLSPTKGITVSSENMVYIWGNYNTTGITGIPAGGSTLNDGGYAGNQVPASIVCDAFSPLSKTWFDALSALYPEGSQEAVKLLGNPYRMADEGASITEGTSVRAGVIAGQTISSLTAAPGRNTNNLRRNGGIINYPRFLELWNLNGITMPWNYTGSFIPLFHSTQMLAQWENDTSVIYMPPRRNWSFDGTFLTPNKMPPGTPFFQYIQATGFRQSLK